MSTSGTICCCTAPRPRQHRRHRLALIGMFFALWGGASVALAGLSVSESVQVHWSLTAKGCGTAAPVQLACGAVGVYHVDVAPITGTTCGPLSLSSSGLPARYPRPQLQGSGAWPCAEGSCYSKAGIAQSEIAVIDWDDPHGWSVGAVIAEVSPGPSFYSLDEPWPRLPQALATADDLHVLRQLCKMAEASSSERPRFVNMSFGRFAGGLSGRCQDASLRCEIETVLATLADDGVTFFAAAGNDGELLFPASSPAVKAVGSLDLASFRAGDNIKPTPETPDAVDVLVPGHGLVLTLHDGTPWGAPPGSSYASALATGWFAEARLRTVTDVEFDWADGPLSIVDPGDSSYRLRLVNASGTMPNSLLAGPAAMVCNALGCPQESSALSPAGSSGRVLEVTGEGQLPAATFGDVARDGQNRPNPGSRPCIPCHDIPDNVLSHLWAEGAGPGLPQPAVTGHRVAHLDDLRLEASMGRDLIIDLSASEGVPTEYTLHGVYLRIGPDVHAFSDSVHPGLLRDLEAGDVDTLTIAAAPADAWTRHTALVWVLATDDGTAFWHATPVAIHGH